MKKTIFVTLAIITFVMLAGCSFEFRYKIILDATLVARNVDPVDQPYGSKGNPVMISGSYDKDNFHIYAGEVLVQLKFSTGIDASAKFGDLYQNGKFSFVSFVQGSPNQAVYAYEDSYGGQYELVICFRTDSDATFTGDIGQWLNGSGPGIGGGAS